MKRAGKKFKAIIIWPLIRKFILHVPHRRLRLLLGSWILATGVLSCNNNTPAEKSRTTKREKANFDTSNVTYRISDTFKINSGNVQSTIDCYIAILVEDTVADDELKGKADSTIDQPKTCYAPVIDMKPEN